MDIEFRPFGKERFLVFALKFILLLSFSTSLRAYEGPEIILGDGAESWDGKYSVETSDSWSSPGCFQGDYVVEYRVSILVREAGKDEWDELYYEVKEALDFSTISTVDNKESGTYEYSSKLTLLCYGANPYYPVSVDGPISTVTVNKLVKPNRLTITSPISNYDVDGEYVIKWQAPVGDVSYYKIEERIKNANGLIKRDWLEVQGEEKGGQTQFTTYGDARDKGYTYEYRVKACNQLECADQWSAIKAINVPLDESASGQFIDPTESISIRPGTTRTLRAIVNDPDGIASVNFYYGAQDLGKVFEGGPDECNGATKCFYLNYAFTVEKSDVIKILVKDIYQNEYEFFGHTIEVKNNSNPIALVDESALPIEIVEGEEIPLRALVRDPDGNETIARVSFLVNGAEIGDGVYTGDSGEYQVWKVSPSWSVPVPSSDSVTFGVRVWDDEEAEGDSYLQPKPVTHLEPPEPPAALTVTGMTMGGEPFPVSSGDAITGANFEVSWDPVADADYYVLQEGVDGNFTDSVWHSPQDSLSAVIPPLPHGTYQYRVGSCSNEIGCSGDNDIWSPVFTIHWMQYAPLTPENFEINPNRANFDFTGSHSLTWDPVTTGHEPQDYRVFSKEGGIESPNPWVELSPRVPHVDKPEFKPKFVIEDLEPGTYSYQVLACNAEHSCSDGEFLSIDVLPPVLYNGSPDGNTVVLQGNGIDPDTEITITNRRTGSQQSFPVGSAQVTWQSPTEQDPAIYATITLNSAMEEALSEEGIRVSVENPNGERAGVDVFASDAVERLSRIESGPAVDSDGIIYVGSGNKVFAVNPEDGSTMPGWPYETGDLVKATPAVDAVSGHIYVGSLDDSLYALSSSGLKKWALKTGGDIYASAVQDEERNLFLASMDGFIYSVQPENGAIRWIYNAGNGIAETPVLASNHVLYYTTVASSQVYALGRGKLGQDQLSWESMDESLLKDDIEELNWQPAVNNLPEFLTAARVYRLLLQPELSLSRDVLTFWTYALLNGASVQEIANAFLKSDTGKVNFPSSMSDEAFVDALYERAFPGGDKPAFNYNGSTYTRNSLLDAMEGGLSRASVAAIFAQSERYVQASDTVLGNAFDYFYTQDYSWAVFACDDPEGSPETIDCDDDGLPDYWEILFFGDIESESDITDADGDGHSNLEAFQSNLDPCAALCYNGITTEPPSPAPMPVVSYEDMVVSGEIGSLPGQFRVNESGAATYHISLNVPAGTAGVTPELSLNYSSHSGNGLVGHGWAIGGLSAISRCRQTYGQDKQAKAITWSSEDRFCLDGQRLVLVSGGEYGAKNSLYRTEIDSYSVIKAHGGTAGHPNYFTIEKKDGSISYYGLGNNSRQTVGEVDSETVQTWAISSFEDSAQNNIEFIYSFDVIRGEGNEPDHKVSHRISEVRYAYSGLGGSAGAIVHFDYEGRTDVISGYLSGELLEVTKLLDGIRVYNDGIQVRRYELEYLEDSRDNLSRLERIRQCAGDNGEVCQPYTVFDWRLPLPGNFPGDSSDTVTLSTKRDRSAIGTQPSDINGDGRMDLIWQELNYDNDGSGRIYSQYFKYVLAKEGGFGEERTAYWVSDKTHHPYDWQMIDFNGDGRSDLVTYLQDLGYWGVVISKPDSEGNWTLSGQPYKLENLTDPHTKFIDIDADGFADAVGINGYHLLKPDPSQGVASPNYYSFGSEVTFDIEGVESWENSDTESVLDGYTHSRYFDPSVMGDFDGDGRVELVLFDTEMQWGCGTIGGDPVLCGIITDYRLLEQHSRAYLVAVDGSRLVVKEKLLDFIQNGGKFSSKNQLWVSDFQNRHDELKLKLHTADINSDGLSDLIKEDGFFENVQKGYANYSYQLSNGAGFEESVDIGEFSVKAQQQWFDYDKDGDVDLVWHDAREHNLKVKRWDSLDNEFGEGAHFRQTSGNGNATHLFVDIDGDSVTDYVRIEDDKAHYYPAINFRVPVNVIEKITNGLGAETGIAYGSLSHSGHYTRRDITPTTELRCETAGYGDVYDPSNSLPRPELCRDYAVADLADYYGYLNDTWEGESAEHRLGKLFPTLEAMGPMYVVTQVDGSSPTTGNAEDNDISSISYYYAQAKIQAGGRGMLGFEKLTTIDEQTGVRTSTYYRQDFPFTGYPERTEVKSESGKLLSRSTTTWKLKRLKDGNWGDWESTWGNDAKQYGSASLGVLQPWLAESVEETYGLNSVSEEPLKKTTTINEYDNYGNPTEIAVTITDSNAQTFTTVTSNSYGEETGKRITFSRSNQELSTYPELGRLTRTEVTKTRTVSADSGTEASALPTTRVSTFDYYSSGPEAGLIWWEKIEPETDFESTTTYTYDSYGNTASSTLTTEGEDPRSSAWFYKNDQGRYLERKENSYGQRTEEVLSRNDSGLSLQVRDMAGVVTYLEYDAFGRKVLEYNETGAHSKTLLSVASSTLCPAGSSYQRRVTRGGGGESLTCFDVLARETRSVTSGFEGARIYLDTNYDELGRVVAKSEPYSGTPGSGQYWTFMEYDILGRVVGTDLPGTLKHNDIPFGEKGIPHDIHVEYDGFTTVTTNPEGHTRKETKNALGELVFVEDHLKGQIKYRYDDWGNLRFVTRYEKEGVPGPETEMRYDNLGRKKYMNDPDKGEWNYGYNGFGELVWQIDANRQKVANQYDKLGRLVHRIDYINADLETEQELNSDANVEGETIWIYNNASSAEGGCSSWEDGIPPGALASVIDTVSGYAQLPSYDCLGRQSLTLTSLAEGDDHWTNITYDDYGRVFQEFDAAGNGLSRSAVQNIYSQQHGYLEAVVDAENINLASAAHYYTVLDMDERGNVTRFRQGNGVETEREYDPATGRLEYQRATVGGALFPVQDLEYHWDNLGNLEYRIDRSGGTNQRKDLREDFEYDELNRLESAWITREGLRDQTPQSVKYDALGNITFKSDVGGYRYGAECVEAAPAGPHALCEITKEEDGGDIVGSLTYDLNGNMVGDDDRTLQYSTFDKPLSIRNKKTGHVTEFKYGPSRSRYLRIDRDSSGQATETRYIGNVEKISGADGDKIKRYLPGGAVVTISGGEPEVNYLHKDHLGSVDVITDKAGSVTQLLSFDAWGQRRNALTWESLIESANTGFDTSVTTRGFTGHEMLDQVKLVHMNGRIYDPRLGRFLQADPFIDGVTDLQGYNRYSYVQNNPLNATDPTGYFNMREWVGAVVFIAGTIICQGNMACGEMGYALVGALAGASQAKANGASGTDVAVAAFTGGVMAYMGASFAGGAGGWTATEMFAFGVAGGVTGALQGGKFGHGFASAFIGAAVGGSLRLESGGGWANLSKGIARIVVSGTISEVTGGKFSNGAATAAFMVMIEAGSLQDPPPAFEGPTPDIKIEGSFSGGTSSDIGVVSRPEDPGYSPHLYAPPEIPHLEEVYVTAYAPVRYDLSEAVAIYYRRLAARRIERQLQADYSNAVANYQSWVRFSNTANYIGAGSVGLFVGSGTVVGLARGAQLAKPILMRGGKNLALAIDLAVGEANAIASLQRVSYIWHAEGAAHGAAYSAARVIKPRMRWPAY